mgnify:CR=1 FL=1|tara:strand:- start:185 stop:832 length:648 start_codon:yes stop_codon:yes gene_type:complete
MKALVPFGPLIYQGDMSEELLEFLLECVDKSRNGDDRRWALAGHMDNEREAILDLDSFRSFIDIHIKRFLYLNHERRSSLDELHDSTRRSQRYKDDLYVQENVLNQTLKYDLNYPWVNFQKKGEFNPIHEHTGNISAIMFIDIPEEINHENDNDEHQVMSHGCLEFVYDNSKTMLITPKTGMIFLFPSELKHCVYPFKSDVERITMSFNLHNLTL